MDVAGPYDGDRLINLDAVVVFEPGDYVNGRWSLRFLAESDGAWSDEDCLWDTHGHTRLDNLTVTVDGVVVSDNDFEDGHSDWTPGSGDLVGDFTALRQGLGDLDPDHENSSWQVTFIDDGEVVPELPGTPCVDWCYGPDGWVYNVTAGLDGHGVPHGPLWTHGNSGVWNGLISPVMAWPEGADRGQLAFDVYAHMQEYACGATAYGWAYRATNADDPDDLLVQPWAFTNWSLYQPEVLPPGPGYFRIEVPLIAGGNNLRWVQVRFEVVEAGPWCWGDYVSQGTPAPYFDNVAVTAWQTITDAPAAAALSLSAAPNPFNPRITLRWSQPSPGPVDLAVYDVRGMLVRRLVEGERPAGAGEVAWDGCDGQGRGLAAGTYLARLRTSAGTELRKLTLVR